MDVNNLCNALGNDTGKAVVTKELERRGTFTPDEWVLIREKSVKIGERQLVVICTMGWPSRVNKSMTAAGSSDQWIYEVAANKFVYMYLTNGILTAWQN